MSIIARGSVKIQLEVSDAIHHTINQLRANDFFGEMSSWQERNFSPEAFLRYVGRLLNVLVVDIVKHF